MILLRISLLVLLGVLPALAHPGDHSAFSWAQLADHLFEPDHFVFLALIVITGVLAYRLGRRAEARRRAERDR